MKITPVFTGLKIEKDIENHQWVLKYHHLTREVSFFKDESDVERIYNEMTQEFRNEQLENILRINEL